MEIKYTVSDNKVDVKLIGELDTPATAEIQPEIDKLLALSANDFTIDCSGLSYISSTGLRQLICIHKKCRAEGGQMTLVGVTPDAMEIFSVTGFHKIFCIR